MVAMRAGYGIGARRRLRKHLQFFSFPTLKNEKDGTQR